MGCAWLRLRVTGLLVLADGFSFSMLDPDASRVSRIWGVIVTMKGAQEEGEEGRGWRPHRSIIGDRPPYPKMD